MDGDEKTKFFHGFINCKNKKNKVNGLSINVRWTTELKEIKDEAFRFFRDKFHKN